MKIAICDDEKQCRDDLYNMIKEYFKDDSKIIIHSYKSGEELLSKINNQVIYDLVFMDIFMQGRNGMEIAKTIYKMNSKINFIFISTTKDFAVESYDVEAKGYIVKPIVKENLFSLLDKLKFKYEQFLVVKQRQITHLIQYDDILFLESKAHKVSIITASGEEYICWEKLNDLKEQLNSSQFLQCHQSYIVNMDYIIKADDDFLLKNKKVIPIKVKDRRKIKEQYYNYIIGEE